MLYEICRQLTCFVIIDSAYFSCGMSIESYTCIMGDYFVLILVAVRHAIVNINQCIFFVYGSVMLADNVCIHYYTAASLNTIYLVW